MILKALFNNVFTFKTSELRVPIHAISVFEKTGVQMKPWKMAPQKYH